MQWIRKDEWSGFAPSLQEKILAFLRGHPNANIEHDVNWLSARAKLPGRSLRLYVALNESNDVVAFAPFFGHPSSLSVDVLRKTVFSISAQRFTINAGPLLTDIDEERGYNELFDVVARDLQRNQFAYILACPIANGGAQRFFEHSHRSARSVKLGAPEMRRCATIPNNLEGYLGLLSSSTRQDLKRHERKLIKHVNGNLVTKRFTAESEVAEFLSIAANISNHTYQSQVFHSGVTDDESTAEFLRAAARLGRLRCFVLFCASEPVAFMLGYTHGVTYYSESIGYLPAWKEWGVGNTLHLHVINDLATVSGIHSFDFMYSDNANKARLSTEGRLEQNVIVFSRLGAGRWIGMAYQASVRLSSVASTVLDRLGVKERLRSMLRSSA
jgi:Acetyltransferase (GNAT) domain